MTTKEIKHLVTLLQSGDMTVFDDIYHHTKNIVYYTIFNILKDTNISEDIMQDTYLKALEKIHYYKPRSSFKSWIVTIARNLALNEYNKRKKDLNIDITVDEYVFGSVEDSSEKEMMIKEMLTTLDSTEREIVVLHVIGDLKHREIAEVMDVSEKTVNNHIVSAIKKISIELKVKKKTSELK